MLSAVLLVFACQLTIQVPQASFEKWLSLDTEQYIAMLEKQIQFLAEDVIPELEQADESFQGGLLPSTCRQCKEMSMA